MRRSRCWIWAARPAACVCAARVFCCCLSLHTEGQHEVERRVNEDIPETQHFPRISIQLNPQRLRRPMRRSLRYRRLRLRLRLRNGKPMWPMRRPRLILTLHDGIHHCLRSQRHTDGRPKDIHRGRRGRGKRHPKRAQRKITNPSSPPTLFHHPSRLLRYGGKKRQMCRGEERWSMNGRDREGGCGRCCVLQRAREGHGLSNNV